MSINLRRLRAFVCVAQARSVTEAAREMNMTPPAVTKSLKELETTLAVELFRRTSSGMLLTPAGETFLLHAERALSEIDRGREEVAMLMGGVGGRVAVGATVEAAMLVLPIALGRLIERRRQMEVSLNGGTFDSLSREVRTGALDFFLGVAPPEGVIGNLASEPLYADELRIVARPGHPLASRKSLTLADLAEFRWIQSASHGPINFLIRSSLAESGVSFPEDAVIIEPLSSMRGLLQNSDLIAAVTSVRLREEFQLGQLVELPVSLPHSQHVVSIIRRDETYLSSWAKELIALLRRVAKEFDLAV
jgi:LysR family transcriptional regulator, regulator for genes of the gallate degradation pathway